MTMSVVYLIEIGVVVQTERNDDVRIMSDDVDDDDDDDDKLMMIRTATILGLLR